MPKTRRNKVVSLTKVKKRPREKKEALIEEIREVSGVFQRCYIISVENDRANFMQAVRQKFRTGRLFYAKNKVMQLALGTTAATECQDGIHQISERIIGRVALLFTNQPPAEVQGFFAEYRPSDFARCGATATEKVVLPRGQDALDHLPHSMEAHLRQCGLPTQLLDGKIHLLGDHTVCKEGQELTSDAAQILKLLDVKQAQFILTVEAHWKRGGEFVDCTELED